MSALCASMRLERAFRPIEEARRESPDLDAHDPASRVIGHLRRSYESGDQAAAVRLVQAHRGDGSPLSPGLRSSMEARFGRGLADVRIHTDAFAGRAASCLRANAFTVGDDIFFGRGRFEPETPEGARRLAHELAHVLQGRGEPGPNPPSVVERLEREAEVASGRSSGAGEGLSLVGPMLLREPTYPRRTTGSDMIVEVERVLGLSRDRGSRDPTHRLWSNVDANFVLPTTAGTCARRVWTYIFLRHFTEADITPGTESAHARYFYSRVYGWIDGQHFFGFIDFAEQQYRNSGGDRQAAFAAATEQGHDIERNQQKIRDYIVLDRPGATDKTRLMQVDPPNTLLFRGPQALAATLAQGAADAIAFLKLGDSTQGQLLGLLDDAQRQKFWVDCAKSAFTYEDFRSNQLGVRFFYQHGIRLNDMAGQAREGEFRNALFTFFNSIAVENDPATVDGLASGLPRQEQFSAGKTTEDLERQRNPELFRLPTR